jgi:hypothetical protein
MRWRRGGMLLIPSHMISAGVQTLGVTATGNLLTCMRNGSVEGPDGFPQILETSFQDFRDHVPHLFKRGEKIIGWLDSLEGCLRDGLGPEEGRHSALGALQTLRTMVQTAAVTAPPDLWLQRQILSAQARSHVWDRLEKGEEIRPSEGRGTFDLQFLWTRDVLEHGVRGYIRSPSCPYPLAADLMLPEEFRTDLAGLLFEGFRGSLAQGEEDRIERWLRLPSEANDTTGWQAGRQDLEIGYRLLPLVLGLHASGVLKGLTTGSPFPDVRWKDLVGDVLVEAGLLNSGLITGLGARVFERGPGIFGIIGAYHTYLTSDHPWVERGKNIAASRDANRKSFETAVDLIQEAALRPTVVIEHAVGLGIGIQTFVKKLGSEGIQFVAADYEEAALEGTRREQEAGRVPSNTKFVRSDIGRPETLLDFLKQKGIDPRGAVMIVGNGFHEARGLTGEGMIDLLRQYREAGIIIVFTEESGLTDDQIRAAAWNTYHAGFRYTHQISGQGPRPPWPMDPPAGRLSWLECAEGAGYRIPRRFRRGTRTIFPCDLPEERNPPISVTFLCLP